MFATPSIPEFTDARHVAIYDTVNSYSPDAQPSFYLALAQELDARVIVDVGCGTGLITLQLTRDGHRVIGVDPSPLMLGVARSRADADRVEWIEGGVERLESWEADLAIMSGHVPQFFLTDTSWEEAVAAIHKALRPGGTLAFESRDPNAREWEQWLPTRRRVVSDPTFGEIECWCEVTAVQDSIVSSVNYRRITRTGEELVSPTRLRFRTANELVASLGAKGFSVEQVFGDWGRCPPGPTTHELIVVATRR